MNEIEIDIAKMAVAKSPAVLVAKSLGSCVAIALYDPTVRVGAMVHIMLPDSTHKKRKSNSPGKFADTAVPVMIDKMVSMGAIRSRIVAKIAGGAKMFTSVGTPMDIGSRIVDAVKDALRKDGIRTVAQDVGKDYGRTVEFNTNDGSIRIKAFGIGVKII